MMNIKFLPIKSYIFLSAVIFFCSLFLGVIVGKFYPTLVTENLNSISDKFSSVRGAPSYVVFSFIFLNNTLIDIILITSFFIFGLGPLFILSTNGFTAGIIIGLFSKEIGLATVLSAIIPHGLIEIPAFFIAAACGFFLAIKFYRRIFYKEDFRVWAAYALNVLLKIVIPLNFIAAIVETYITPLVYSLFVR